MRFVFDLELEGENQILLTTQFFFANSDAFAVSVLASTLRATGGEFWTSSDGVNDYVTFGPASTIGAPKSTTYETWFKRDGRRFVQPLPPAAVVWIPFPCRKGPRGSDGRLKT